MKTDWPKSLAEAIHRYDKADLEIKNFWVNLAKVNNLKAYGGSWGVIPNNPVGKLDLVTFPYKLELF